MAEEKVEETGTEELPDPPTWATVPRPGRSVTPAQRLREADFPLALRGYDRAAVDQYVADAAEAVAELESARMRQPVVQRALEEVGEQTGEILSQAHRTAEEITARSRAQAEGRLQRAEREAADIRRDAEDAVRRLEADNEGLFAERRQLIEEIRAMAQDVLAVADAALDRLPPPQGGAEPPADQAPAGGGESEAAEPEAAESEAPESEAPESEAPESEGPAP